MCAVGFKGGVDRNQNFTVFFVGKTFTLNVRRNGFVLRNGVGRNNRQGNSEGGSESPKGAAEHLLMRLNAWGILSSIFGQCALAAAT